VEGSANVVAWAALVLCFPVSLLIVARWRASISVPIILIVGQMLLPERLGFEIEGHFPMIDKTFLPQVGALCGCLIFRPKSLKGGRPFRGFDLFIWFRIAGYFFSCMTNRDPLVFPHGIVSGLSFLAFVGGALKIFFYWWPALFLGSTVIKTSKDLRNLFRILTGAALVYSLFVLIEMRTSPQLNRWIYGYHQHDFIQSIKSGSYRPMVFMRHGLVLAFFLAISVVAASSVAKIKARVLTLKARTVAVYLMVILVLCRSFGATMYAVIAMPLVWFTKPRTQVRVAIVMALLAFSYPVARAFGLLPVDDINDFVLEKFGDERAGSLSIRLSEEEYIMQRTIPRWVFGWGGPPRAFRLDPVTGANRSTTDGMWAIIIGQEGAVGFVCVFGMFLYPILRSRRALSKLPTSDDRILVAGLAIIVALLMVELIPNSSIEPYLTFLVGTLAGVTRRGLDPDPDSLAEAPPLPRELAAQAWG
jgi:hypothetical protein